MSETDAELVSRAQRGDRSAFAVLVYRYQPALLRVATSRLGTPDAAADIVQETFLAAYKSRHSFNPQFGFRTWLWTILLNQCRRYASHAAREAKTLPLCESSIDKHCGASRPELNVPELSPLAHVLAAERRELLEMKLRVLNPTQADALRLRFFGGLKFQEIADAMQCSLLTAKNRVRNGLLHLAALIEPSEPTEPPRSVPTSPDSAPAQRNDGSFKTPLQLPYSTSESPPRRTTSDDM